MELGTHIKALLGHTSHVTGLAWVSNTKLVTCESGWVDEARSTLVDYESGWVRLDATRLVGNDTRTCTLDGRRIRRSVWL